MGESSKLILRGALSAIGVFIYVAAVAWLMFNGEKFFGKATSFWMPVALLLLFVLSAAITGLLVLGKPILLYFNGERENDRDIRCHQLKRIIFW
jgi:hypothetical protein